MKGTDPKILELVLAEHNPIYEWLNQFKSATKLDAHLRDRWDITWPQFQQLLRGRRQLKPDLVLKMSRDLDLQPAEIEALISKSVVFGRPKGGKKVRVFADLDEWSFTLVFKMTQGLAEEVERRYTDTGKLFLPVYRPAKNRPYPRIRCAIPEGEYMEDELLLNGGKGILGRWTNTQSAFSDVSFWLADRIASKMYKKVPSWFEFKIYTPIVPEPRLGVIKTDPTKRIRRPDPTILNGDD